jgi:hypothetical protein
VAGKSYGAMRRWLMLLLDWTGLCRKEQETKGTRADRRGGRKREAMKFHRDGGYGATKYTEWQVLHRRIARR